MPRSRERATSRGRYTQGDLEAAVREVENGSSIRNAAVSYGMSPPTLMRAIRKKSSSGIVVKKSIGVGTIFTSGQEEQLLSFIQKSAKMFHGLSLTQTQKLAYSFATNIGINVPKPWKTNRSASYDWLYLFRKRHPELVLRLPEKTSLARAAGFNKEAVGSFFSNFEKACKQGKFSAHQIWNLDETGVTTVQKATKVLATKGVKQLGQIASQERGSLITICCCINAGGESIPPCYIFPRVHFQPHMLKGGMPGSLGLANKSGWMTTELFTAALSHFIKYMRVSKANPAILLMDNHTSHVSHDTVKLARENGLVIVTFPPHCSHRLQPLDVAVYGPLKAYYNSACSAWMLSHPGVPITIYDVAELTKSALLKAATPENVQKGFQATGIYPLNKDIFTDDMFLPATVTAVKDTAEPTPSTSASGLPPLPKAVSHTKKRSTARKASAIHGLSSTEEEDDVILDDSSELSTPQSTDEEDEADQLQESIGEGNFLVAKVPGKKTTQNFVCKVLHMDRESETLVVSFLKRSSKGRHFVMSCPEEESEIDFSQIVTKLPTPGVSGGTARRGTMLSFNGAEEKFMVHS